MCANSVGFSRVRFFGIGASFKGFGMAGQRQRVSLNSETRTKALRRYRRKFRMKLNRKGGRKRSSVTTPECNKTEQRAGAVRLKKLKAEIKRLRAERGQEVRVKKPKKKIKKRKTGHKEKRLDPLGERLQITLPETDEA